MTALRKELIELTEILLEEKIFEVLQFIREKILPEKKSAFGILSKYADKNLISQEKSAWEKSASEKYEKNSTRGHCLKLLLRSFTFWSRFIKLSAAKFQTRFWKFWTKLKLSEKILWLNLWKFFLKWIWILWIAFW